MSGLSPSTRAVRAGIESDAHHGAVVPALHLSTNYTFEAFNRKRRYDYSRSGNPTRDLLAEALADLEEGAGAVVTASGMAAVALALELVPAGGQKRFHLGIAAQALWYRLHPAFDLAAGGPDLPSLGLRQG